MNQFKQKNTSHTFIYKLSSKRFKQSNWNLSLPLNSAIKNKKDIVALNNSQILRWIREINKTEHFEKKIEELKTEIKNLKKRSNNKQNRKTIQTLYKQLYTLQYEKDYFCMIMDSNQDYDQANQGFQINGYSYHRLLGTNSGIKKSTIVYVGDQVYKEILKRMDNGRDKSKPMIPAKLEAYQALICSASTPVPMPRILVVKDCIVSFQEKVLTIQDECDGEPQLTYDSNYTITHCDSDGYGLMSPAYSRRINQYLFELDTNETISGVNVRYAWTKGMLFTFDFVAFAKLVNQENYQIQDAWGTYRDVRNYDVILTTSMVKLWDSYQSLEHFLQCSMESHYQFSVTKTAPHQLEHTRNANYQFLQTYSLSDEELYALCKPTIDEIQSVLGTDWRKAIVFAKGMFLTDKHVEQLEDDFIKALMIDKRLMKDSYVIQKLHAMIQKRMQMAAKGSIQLNGNFALVSGDPYSLAQSIFGLPITGLLKTGEVYHKYWIDKQVKEIALFRAPMTCHNNIRKRSVVHNDEMDFWYQYNTTGIILNSWDSTCDATNGSDKDGDLFFTTNNPILLAHTLNATTIECIQRKAEKIIPTEQDLILANKLSFGDEIGTTTNRITTMIERQACFHPDSEEYKTLDYRIKCGQHFQQNTIDKAKGILSKPMPKYWYQRSACEKLPENTEQEKQFKELCKRIVAERKPYFMKYIYPDLMLEYKKYIKASNSKCMREFQTTIPELLQKPNKTIPEKNFLEYYHKQMPVGTNPCIINRIAWLFEHTFSFYGNNHSNTESFDSNILKSGVSYNKKDFQQIAEIKSKYDDAVKYYQQIARKQRLDKEEINQNRQQMLSLFKAECESICPNEKVLCDIVIDLCYSTSKCKQFAWDICGTVIIQNLLEKNNHTIHYPVLVQADGEFKFAGEAFRMCQKKIQEEETS